MSGCERDQTDGDRTHQGFACKVSEKIKSSRNSGGAVGSGSSSSGKNQRVHHIAATTGTFQAVPTRPLIFQLRRLLPKWPLIQRSSGPSALPLQTRKRSVRPFPSCLCSPFAECHLPHRQSSKHQRDFSRLQSRGRLHRFQGHGWRKRLCVHPCLL